MPKIRLILIIILNIFISKIYIFIVITKLNNKYALNNKYIFITEKSAIRTPFLSFSLPLIRIPSEIIFGVTSREY